MRGGGGANLGEGGEGAGVVGRTSAELNTGLRRVKSRQKTIPRLWGQAGGRQGGGGEKG